MTLLKPPTFLLKNSKKYSIIYYKVKKDKKTKTRRSDYNMELVAKSYQNYPQIGEVFLKNGKSYIAIKESCDRCGGNGYSNHPSWAQNNNGKCFKCNGLGYVIEEVRT